MKQRQARVKSNKCRGGQESRSPRRIRRQRIVRSGEKTHALPWESEGVRPGVKPKPTKPKPPKPKPEPATATVPTPIRSAPVRAPKKLGFFGKVKSFFGRGNR